jgi:hypothetical protein
VRRLTATLALTVGLLAGTFGAAAPANAHSTITAPAYDVCAWTGVRDGVLGFGDATKLVQWYRFWYVDHYWVFCKVKLTVQGDISYHDWIVSTHDGYTIHLGPGFPP